MSIVGWQMFENTGGESPCPTITMGTFGFNGAIPIVGTAINGGALISGGSPAYTVGTVTGLPAGLSASTLENAGNWYFILSGTPTTFAIYNVTATVIDANGCESEVKSFTVTVRKSFVNNTPQVVTPVDNFLIPVSGIPAVYGTGVVLERIILSYTSATNGFPTLVDPDIIIDVYLYNTPSNGNVTNAVIYDTTEAYPQFATGSTPYTSNFISGSNSFSELDSTNTIGDWLLYGIDGTINSITLIFKPI